MSRQRLFLLLAVMLAVSEICLAKRSGRREDRDKKDRKRENDDDEEEEHSKEDEKDRDEEKDERKVRQHLFFE